MYCAARKKKNFPWNPLKVVIVGVTRRKPGKNQPKRRNLPPPGSPRMAISGWLICIADVFYIITFLLTVIVPVGVSGQIAVQYGVFTIMFLSVTGKSSDHQPTSILRTAAIVPVDEELATVIFLRESKEVLWLWSYVIPGGISQCTLLEPVQLVWSLGIEIQLLDHVSSFIKNNPCLLKLNISAPHFTRVC